MALWNWNIQEKKYINLKLISVPWPCEKHEAPKFVVLDKDYKETEEKYSSISWIVKFIKWTHTPANPKRRMQDIYWFKAFIEDLDEVYVIESTITNASKDLLNSLLWNKDNKVDISLYLNKNMYPSSAVKINWEYAVTRLDFKWLDWVTIFNEIEKVFPPKKIDESIDINDLPF